MYFVNFTKTAWDELYKINKHKAQEYVDKIKEDLSVNPTDRGKYYGRSTLTNLLYFEKRIYSDGGLRFFYTVNEGVVLVAGVEFEGESKIQGVANKKSQKKVAKRLGL